MPTTAQVCLSVKIRFQEARLITNPAAAPNRGKTATDFTKIVIPVNTPARMASFQVRRISQRYSAHNDQAIMVTINGSGRKARLTVTPKGTNK